MTNTLRVVEAAADLGPDEKVRLVVRALLSMTGMSTLELGAALGLGRTAVYDRTQGRKPFTVAELVRMGSIFGVPPEAFLAGPTALIRGSNPLDTRTVSIKNRPNAPAYPARHHPRTTRTLALCPSAA